MDIFEYGKALTDLWTLGGKTFLSAQESAAHAFAENVGKAMKGAASGTPAPGMPDLSSESADLTRATASVMELWSTATTLANAITVRLPTSLGPAAEGERGLDPVIAMTFQKMLDPRAWLAGAGEMDEMLSRMAEGPRLADLWDIERRYAKVFQAWMVMRRRSLEHNAVTLEAWLRAARRYAEQLGKDNKPETDAKALLDRWIETANRELIDTQRSEPYLRTQAALIRASTELKVVQRELAEYYGERLGFPTPTELDDVHRTVTELRREVRSLRQLLERAESGQSTAAQHPSPRRKVRGGS
jgi:hypothetical protein